VQFSEEQNNRNGHIHIGTHKYMYIASLSQTPAMMQATQLGSFLFFSFYFLVFTLPLPSDFHGGNSSVG
jgi:hypothetical protein